jgi:antitoxin ParD1/3/4
MNVSLTPELEQFVSQKVASGRYQTSSEVIRDGLRLLLEREELHKRKLEELRRDVAAGIAEADQGKVAPLKAGETLARVRNARAKRAEKNR